MHVWFKFSLPYCRRIYIRLGRTVTPDYIVHGTESGCQCPPIGGHVHVGSGAGRRVDCGGY